MKGQRHEAVEFDPRTDSFLAFCTSRVKLTLASIVRFFEHPVSCANRFSLKSYRHPGSRRLRHSCCDWAFRHQALSESSPPTSLSGLRRSRPHESFWGNTHTRSVFSKANVRAEGQVTRPCGCFQSVARPGSLVPSCPWLAALRFLCGLIERSNAAIASSCNDLTSWNLSRTRSGETPACSADSR